MPVDSLTYLLSADREGYRPNRSKGLRPEHRCRSCAKRLAAVDAEAADAPQPADTRALFTNLEQQKIHLYQLVKYWRRGWDSNPRYPCGHNGFRDRPDRPLRHLSVFGGLRRSAGRAF